MSDDAAWDLEMELLCMPSTGGSVRQMQQLSQHILGACDNVPQHVRELAMLPDNSHRERDLHRWAKRQPWRQLLPPAFEFDIPFTRDGIHEEFRPHAAFLPHETFASLAHWPELFNELLCGDAHNLEAFWGASASPWLERHPVPQVSTRPSMRVPLGIHGDDAGLFAAQKVLVLAWGSVAVERLTLDSRILFSAISYGNIVAKKTLAVLYTVLVWSLNCMAIGEFPYCDHNGRPFSAEYCPDRFAKAGQPLAGGWLGIWSELRGDWKWQAEALNLKQHWGTNFCCHLCRAHKRIRRLLYTHFGRNSLLRRTHISYHRFRDQYEIDPQRSPLLAIIGFDIWRCWPDAMHLLDLGLYQFIVASCMFELAIQGVWGGASREERFFSAHVEYVAWCQLHNLPPCPRFQYAKVCPTNDNYAFTQQSAKASQTRYLVRWVCEVLQRPGVSEGMHGGIRLAMFSRFVAFENVCGRNGRYLPQGERDLIAQYMEEALLCLNALAAEAIAAGNLYLWHIVPKAHMASHMAFDCAGAGVNPRRVTCYADEDMVGRMKRVMSRCHGGSAGRMGMERYAILVGTRWWDRLLHLRGIR